MMAVCDKGELRWPGTHLVSLEFLIFLVNEELILGDLGLDGAEKRAALVCVHRLVLETQRRDCVQNSRPTKHGRNMARNTQLI